MDVDPLQHWILEKIQKSNQLYRDPYRSVYGWSTRISDVMIVHDVTTIISFRDRIYSYSTRFSYIKRPEFTLFMSLVVNIWWMATDASFSIHRVWLLLESERDNGNFCCILRDSTMIDNTFPRTCVNDNFTRQWSWCVHILFGSITRLKWPDSREKFVRLRVICHLILYQSTFAEGHHLPWIHEFNQELIGINVRKRFNRINDPIFSYRTIARSCKTEAASHPPLWQMIRTFVKRLPVTFKFSIKKNWKRFDSCSMTDGMLEFHDLYVVSLKKRELQ